MISVEDSLLHLSPWNYPHSNHHHHHHHHHQYNSSSRISLIVLTVSMVFLLITSELKVVSSNPVPLSKGDLDGQSSDTLRRECFPGSELRDLCEMCAKVTRNVNTFPWCCTRQFNVTQWCEEYLSYTIGPNK